MSGERKNFMSAAVGVLLTGMLFLICRKLRAPAHDRSEPGAVDESHGAFQDQSRMGIVGDSEEPAEIVPIQFGAARTRIMLNTFLPQIHLTLISVLQGVALGVLISQFEVLPPLSWEGGLRYTASLLIIVLIWYLYSAVFVIFSWPFSIWHTSLQFVLTGLQCLTFSFISRPVWWTFGCTSMAACGAMIRFMNVWLVRESSYEQEGRYRQDREYELWGGWFLVLLAAVTALVGYLQLRISCQTMTLVAGSTVLAAALAAFAVTERANRRLIRGYLEGSRYAFWRGQVVLRPADD